jgi:hypothetical protein
MADALDNSIIQGVDSEMNIFLQNGRQKQIMERKEGFQYICYRYIKD